MTQFARNNGSIGQINLRTRAEYLEDSCRAGQQLRSLRSDWQNHERLLAGDMSLGRMGPALNYLWQKFLGTLGWTVYARC